MGLSIHRAIQLMSNSSSGHVIHCADKFLDISAPRVMGVLNLTPDSFFDGGQYNTYDLALKRVEEMMKEGADLVDIGGESSRPYARVISQQEEIDRIVPIIAAIKANFDIIISVDTYKPLVMQEAIRLGVHLVNDIKAFRNQEALQAIAASKVGICLMHMQGDPDKMQMNPQYLDVVTEVKDFLQERVTACIQVGISRERIIVDPGFGFGKSTFHNMALLKNLSCITKIGQPVLAGLSRKSSIGEILKLPANERLYGSIAAHVVAAYNGASIIRTHDIKQTAEALKIVAALE